MNKMSRKVVRYEIFDGEIVGSLCGKRILRIRNEEGEES